MIAALIRWSVVNRFLVLIATAFLLAEEKAQGWILPCVAHARSDIVMTRPGHQSLPVV